jgi:O-acetyl-ADP-ribose deacetylase (regulator of RNase III)
MEVIDAEIVSQDEDDIRLFRRASGEDGEKEGEEEAHAQEFSRIEFRGERKIGHQFLSCISQSPGSAVGRGRSGWPPMLHEVSGDILLSHAAAIAHGVAPNDHMNSGLAHSLREDWPAMYKDFRHHSKTSHPEPGSLWVWTGADGRRIIALFTQQPAPSEDSHPGKARIQDVNHCLRALRGLIEKEKFKSIALPRLATGVGGLAWNEVKPLVEQHLGTLQIPVYLYTTFHKGEKAKEPGAA